MEELKIIELDQKLIVSQNIQYNQQYEFTYKYRNGSLFTVQFQLYDNNDSVSYRLNYSFMNQWYNNNIILINDYTDLIDLAINHYLVRKPFYFELNIRDKINDFLEESNSITKSDLLTIIEESYKENDISLTPEESFEKACYFESCFHFKIIFNIFYYFDKLIRDFGRSSIDYSLHFRENRKIKKLSEYVLLKLSHLIVHSNFQGISLIEDQKYYRKMFE